jgi:hypothetical protein
MTYSSSVLVLRVALGSAALACLASACSDPAEVRDAAVADTGIIDSGAEDAGAVDAAIEDAGSEDDDAGPLSDAGGEACVGPDVLAPFQFFIEQLTSTSPSLADWAAANELTAFLMTPGLPHPPGVSLQQSELSGPCTERFVSEEVCAGRARPYSCSSYECTGSGAGWIARMRTEPVDAGGWRFEEARVATSWSTPGLVTFEIASRGTGPGGRDWSCTGSGSARVDSLDVQLLLPDLDPAGPATFSYSITAAPVVREGELRFGDRVVATVDPTGTLVAATDCP